MTIYNKVLKWASENGYEDFTQEEFKETYICLRKNYSHLSTETKTRQLIIVDLNKGTTFSEISHSDYTDSFAQLEILFVPLNRVKDDEENLKKYLGDN